MDSPSRFRLALLAPVVVGLLTAAAPNVLARSTAPPGVRSAPDGRPLALEARPDGFLARGDRYNVLLRPSGQLVALREPLHLERNAFGRLLPQRKPPRQAGFTVRFLGARGDASADASSPLAPVRYVRRDSVQRVPTFAEVIYRGLYPGIDLAYHGTGASLQADWHVGPGADPARIRLALDGVDALERRPDGGIVLTARGLSAALTRPVAFQETGGVRRLVPASWIVDGRTLSFTLGAYDRDVPLVIDPKLEATVTVGGNDVDTFLDVDADAAGNLVAVGATIESSFPRVGNGPFQPGGSLDGIVVTISPSLQVLSTTIVGGFRDDFFQRVDAGPPGEWIISGATTSPDFPVAHALDGRYEVGTCGDGPCVDALLLAFRNGVLRFSTYVGGARDDGITSIALDRGARGGNGLLVFGGFSNSAEFVRAAGYDDVLGIVQYEALDDLRVGSSYRVQPLGGAGNDAINAVAVRGDLVYAVGGGRSTSQVAAGTFLGYENAFVVYSRDGGRTWQDRVYSSTGAFSELDAVTIDADGAAYVGFAGFFPGGNYGSCTFGSCQPIGFVRLDASTFAPGDVATLLPPPGSNRYTLQDLDVQRAPGGAIEGLGAAVNSFPSFALSATPTGVAAIVGPGPRVTGRTELPEGTVLWGSAFAGNALFVVGAAPEDAFPSVRGEADAFVSKVGDLGLADCRCVSITAAADGVKVSRSALTFTLRWAMACTGGAGECQGELAVEPPRGSKITQPTHGVRCGPSSCTSAAKKGSFRVSARSAGAARSGKRFTFRIREWCLVGGARRALPAGRITVAFRKDGAIDRAGSDLNGDGKRDGPG